MTDPYEPYQGSYPTQPQLPSVPSGPPYPHQYEATQPYPVAQPYQPVPYVPPLYVDPYSGQLYSDKSKVAAGLLQLLPAVFFNLGGIGRLYAGNTALGVTQLLASILAWPLLLCLFWTVVPILLSGGLWLWFVIDGIVMLAGRPVDGQGRLLRS